MPPPPPSLQAQFSSSQRVTGISKELAGGNGNSLGNTMQPQAMHELLR